MRLSQDLRYAVVMALNNPSVLSQLLPAGQDNFAGMFDDEEHMFPEIPEIDEEILNMLFE